MSVSMGADSHENDVPSFELATVVSVFQSGYNTTSRDLSDTSDEVNEICISLTCFV